MESGRVHFPRNKNRLAEAEKWGDQAHAAIGELADARTRLEEATGALAAHKADRARLRARLAEAERKRGDELNGRARRLEHELSLVRPGSEAKRLMEEEYQRMQAELAAVTRERDAPGLWGFVVDLSNQPCLEWAEGAGGDFPCDQTSACATEWCPHCRARMILRATTPEGSAGE